MPGGAPVPAYTGSCTIHAVAECCKQHCRQKHHKHPPPPPQPYYSYDQQQYGSGSSSTKQKKSAPPKQKKKQMRTNYQRLDDYDQHSTVAYQDDENTRFVPYNGEDDRGKGGGQRASFMQTMPVEESDSDMQWQAAPPPARKKVRKRHVYMGVDAKQA
jgi:hypothetical protein